MQLVSITIYNSDGRRRDVRFRLGELNIVTGVSRNGKSSLLTIVDYCLGRDSAPVPRTDWFTSIAWYATIWQFEDGSRVLLARPATHRGVGTSAAMLETGGSDFEAPDFEYLRVNVDSDALRIQVGARIGLADARLESGESARGAFAVGLGSAVYFTLQEQQEIGNKSALFHRQDNPGVAMGIRDTLPFFLGAVDGGQAAKRARLRIAKQVLRRAEAALATAELELGSRDNELRQLLAEAASVGLRDGAAPIDHDSNLLVLLNAIRFGQAAGNLDTRTDIRAQDERRGFEKALYELAQQLTTEVGNRDLLLDQRDGEGGYDDSLSFQVGRLQSLNLLPEHVAAHSTCPVCMQNLPHPDPTVGQLNERLESLRQELVTVEAIRPLRQRAIQELDSRIASLREELNVANAALASSGVAAVVADAGSLAGRQEFVRGRIDAILSKTETLDDSHITRLRAERDTAEASVDALEYELDSGDVRSQLTSRLNALAVHLARYSRALDLEESDKPIRLDAEKLTIVVDTELGPLPLQNIGSGENWVGYHVAAHLALHHFFIKQNRPVPRFLMLDQPSQAHFQSDNLSKGSDLVLDEDREAVRNMFKLFKSFSKEFAGVFQLIVVDHADYEDEWFRESVVHNWRGGVKLIPDDWHVADDEPEAPFS